MAPPRICANGPAEDPSLRLAVTEDNREIQPDMISNDTVLNISVAVNPTVRPDNRLAFDMGIRANNRVLAYGRFLTQVDRVRILKGDTSVHPLPAELFLARCFHTSKLLSRIHPFDFVTVRREHSLGRQSGLDCRRNDVGQIVFALDIYWLETIERREEKVCRNTVYAGIDFPDAALLCRGVTRLNNADYLPVGAANNTAVLSWVGALRGQNREGLPGERGDP